MSTILKILAYDRPGVLDRIVGLIRRQGWNIDTLSAADADREAGVSQINIALSGRNVNLRGLGALLSELDTVKSWEEAQPDQDVIWELLLFRLAPAQAQLVPAGARMVAEEAGWLFYEFSGPPAAVAELLRQLGRENIAYARTGALMLSKEEGGREA